MTPVGRTEIPKGRRLFQLWPQARSRILKEGSCQNSWEQRGYRSEDCVCPAQTLPQGVGQPSPGPSRSASPFPEACEASRWQRHWSPSAGLESRLLSSGSSSLFFLCLHIPVSHRPSMLKASKINEESKSSREKPKNYPSVR